MAIQTAAEFIEGVSSQVRSLHQLILAFFTCSLGEDTAPFGFIFSGSFTGCKEQFITSGIDLLEKCLARETF